MLQNNVFAVGARHWRLLAWCTRLLWSCKQNVTWEFNTPHCNIWPTCGSIRVNPWSQMLCASGVPQSCLSQQQHGLSSECSSARESKASFSIRQLTFLSIDWHASLLGAWTAWHRSCYGTKHVFSGTMQEIVVPQSCRSPVGFGAQLLTLLSRC